MSATEQRNDRLTAQEAASSNRGLGQTRRTPNRNKKYALLGILGMSFHHPHPDPYKGYRFTVRRQRRTQFHSWQAG